MPPAPDRVPALDPGPDVDLVGGSVARAAALLDAARERTSRGERRRQARLRRILSDPGGTRLVFSLADRVLRPVDGRAAAHQLAVITAGALPGTSAADRSLLRLAGATARVVPRPVV
ncbi:MAG TPA: hypothetical protein VGR90_04965, partial [Acidimicrobiales bacterium]|nr:hypothetical protein [Acidimicrobiales bacterium]